MLSWMFRITGPTQINRCLFRHDVLVGATPDKTVEKVSRVRTDLHRLGVKVADVPELKAKHQDVVGLTAKVKKRTKGEYVDIFINGLVGDAIPF
jgi:hypothetical protein